MPRSRKDDEASPRGGPEDDGMPPGAMDDNPASGEMPEGGMDGAGETERDDESGGVSRFREEGFGGGAVQPGLVELELREAVQPGALETADGDAPTLRSPSGALGALNEILKRNSVLEVEYSFAAAAETAHAAADGLAGGDEPPESNLQNFVTLHFPPDVDTHTVAAELRELPEVARAVPVPTFLPPDARPPDGDESGGVAVLDDAPAEVEQVAVPAIVGREAAPPSSALGEPLVGTTDQLAVNPQGTQYQWYVFRCRANLAWNLASGSNVVVADIDWGYRTTHEDLKPRLDMTRAYNAYDGSSNVSYGAHVSHGTAVMGLAGGAVNSLGMAGFAYGSSLWPVQANAGPGAKLPGDSWANAIEWVRTAPSGGRRKVIILEVQTGSYGNIEMVPSVNAAIKNAIASGVVVCVAAGNGNRDATKDDQGNTIPPTGSILVGATAYHATSNPRASFSNYGSTVVVSAPGDPSADVTCNSTADDAYRNGFGGTSGATPKVAAVAALMLQVNPALTHAEVRNALRSTGSAVATTADKPVGTFLNAQAAVQAVSPSWKPWAAVGGVCRHGPAVAARRHRLDAFVINNAGALEHNHFNGLSWGGFTSLGGVCIHAPAAVGRGNRLDAFVIGTNGAAFHRHFDGTTWTPFASLGGTCIRGIAAASPTSNRLDVFVVGTDNGVFQKTRIDGAPWSAWTPLGGAAYSAPAAVSRSPGRLDLFYLGANNAVFHRHFNGTSWSAPVSLGGVGQRGVSAAWDGTRLTVFVIGAGNQLYHRRLEAGAWSPWSSVGGTAVSAPASVSRGANRIDAFVIGTDSRLWQRSYA
jgi:subtilisin family serine protease